jgi:hypothetical protein
MSEIWLNGAAVAQQNFNRHPEKGDIIELDVNGPYEDYVVERKAVFYDRQGGMTERIFVVAAP